MKRVRAAKFFQQKVAKNAKVSFFANFAIFCKNKSYCRICRLSLLFFCVGLLSSAGAVDLDLPKEIPDEPFDIRAERLEYTNDTLIASGGVTGRFENVVIRADRVSGNPQTGDLRMEGDIHFERGNMLWQGSELDYNYITQTGDFGPSTLNYDPILMSVDHVERVSTNEFMLQGANFSTCSRDHQHYHLWAKEARLIDEEYLVAKGVKLYLGEVPVFYLPYWRQELNQGVFSFGAGMGSEWGAYGLVKATVPVTENVDWITDVNFYSKRGVGMGQGLAWDTPNAVGEFAAFYLKDGDPHSKFDVVDPIGSLIGDDRYRFKFEHLQRFTDTHYVNTKLNYLSDPAFLEEFFKREHRRDAQPENYASWVYGNSAVGSEVFASKRLNDFYDNTDRVEYSADLYRTRLGNSPLYWQSENAIASLEKVHMKYILPGAGADYDSVRIDSANTLTMPQRFGFLSWVPRATYRATYYSKTAGAGEELRQIPGVGMELSFQATKVLSERERWYGKGLRHKIEPYADYAYEDSSIGTNKLHYFDSVDQLGDANTVKLGLRNVLQTKRNGRVSRFIDLDLYTRYRIEKNGSDYNFDSFFVDARMPLTQRMMIDVEGELDWNGGHVPFFDTRIAYDHDDYVLSFEHLYYREKSLWTPRVDLFPKKRFSLEAYARYESKTTDLEEITVAGYMSWCCMRYGLGVHFYDEDELSLMFSIGLSAFPEVRF